MQIIGDAVLLKSDIISAHLKTQQYGDVPWWILVNEIRQSKSRFSFLLGLLLSAGFGYL